MSIAAVLLAAGNSNRITLSENKVLYELNGLPLFVYPLKTVIKLSKYIDEIYLVVNRKIYNNVKYFLEKHFSAYKDIIILLIGGNSRSHSVYKTINKIKTNYLIITDVARPFVPISIYRTMIGILLNKDISCVVPYLHLVDSLRKIEVDNSVTILDRDKYRILQTPQAFIRKVLMDKYNEYKDKYGDESLSSIRDDSSLIDSKDTIFIPGSEMAFKVTTNFDLKLASLIKKYDL